MVTSATSNFTYCFRFLFDDSTSSKYKDKLANLDSIRKHRERERHSGRANQLLLLYLRARSIVSWFINFWQFQFAVSLLCALHFISNSSNEFNFVEFPRTNSCAAAAANNNVEYELKFSCRCGWWKTEERDTERGGGVREEGADGGREMSHSKWLYSNASA